MKNFELLSVADSIFSYLIIAKSYISPISELEDIQKELSNLSGEILFDLTLINGTNSNRYISGSIVHGLFDRKSFKTVEGISSSIKEISRKFFIENQGLVDGGVIPQPIKYLLKCGEL